VSEAPQSHALDVLLNQMKKRRQHTVEAATHTTLRTPPILVQTRHNHLIIIQIWPPFKHLERPLKIGTVHFAEVYVWRDSRYTIVSPLGCGLGVYGYS
jgi:hypothetical protein